MHHPFIWNHPSNKDYQNEYGICLTACIAFQPNNIKHRRNLFKLCKNFLLKQRANIDARADVRECLRRRAETKRFKEQLKIEEK